ncbi:MAG: hypothetical protein DRP42_00120 [Tenericutes bacterium]|nr:MAG: hypothetical protein DRP42_00120 [Mycoplasmatota bacterium]
MSKSLGNITDPIEMIETYSRDAIRFYLMTSISTGDDGKISNELVEELYNGILVNKYANLVSRTFKMIVKYRDGIIPDIKPELLDNFEITKNDFESKVDSFEYNKAMKT